MLNKKIKSVLIATIILIVLSSFLIWQNNSITINKIVYKTDKITEVLDGYKILQISDLHNKEFGKNQKNILLKIEKINPDIIVVTGDIIDSSKTNIDVAMELINGLVEVAPIYYVTGNHEDWSSEYGILRTKLEEAGVHILDDEKEEIYEGNSHFNIIGLSNATLEKRDYLEENSGGQTLNLLNTLVQKDSSLNLLLAHRPEIFDIYSKSNVDLVFSGHAHGGQVRIPFIGGLIAPDQGLFPKLTEGVHIKHNTTMVISRGLGNSIIPVRIFNRPELVVVNLQRK